MDKNTKMVIKKQSHSDCTKWHSTDALSDRSSGWFHPRFMNFPNHGKFTWSPGIPRLSQACKNLNFSTNTLTLLPWSKLLVHAYCHRSQQHGWLISCTLTAPLQTRRWLNLQPYKSIRGAPALLPDCSDHCCSPYDQFCATKMGGRHSHS